jgi:hypothetical protein
MAWIAADGFDFYTTASNATFQTDAGTYWDTVGNFNNILTAAGSLRFGVGTAVQFGSAIVASLIKTSSTNDAGHHCVFAYKHSGSSGASGNSFTITLFDGATAQCSFVIDPQTIYGMGSNLKSLSTIQPARSPCG